MQSGGRNRGRGNMGKDGQESKGECIKGGVQL